MLVIKETDHNSVELACQILRDGKIISFATDTVYGIAVDASNSKAVKNLYEIKNRDEGKPIAIFVKDLAAAENFFFFDDLAKEISKKFFPGQLTLVLKTRPKALNFIARNLNRNRDSFLGFRIVNSFFVKKLFEKFDGILAVTSANLSNDIPATSVSEVKKYFAKLDLILDGGVCKESPSTVAKISDNRITILRHGSVNLSEYENK